MQNQESFHPKEIDGFNHGTCRRPPGYGAGCDRGHHHANHPAEAVIHTEAPFWPYSVLPEWGLFYIWQRVSFSSRQFNNDYSPDEDKSYHMITSPGQEALF